MLYYLGEFLKDYFGPFRLFTSYVFLVGFGLFSCWVLSWLLLPRFSGKLPSDRGREFAVQGDGALGKPTGAGILFISIYLVIMLLALPFSIKYLIILTSIFLAMLFGYLDDRSSRPWSEYLKALFDLIPSLIAAFTLWHFKFNQFPIWLPFTTVEFYLQPHHAYVFIPLATLFIWVIINTVNCTDGVDGLSSTLAIIALLFLGFFLYFIVGHVDTAKYLLVPHYPDGAGWGIMAFSMVGSLAGYLWHNAYPSSLLMGDAGSRAMGLVIGILVLNTGNPFIVLIVASVVLVNGGTGLLKVALLRFFKIGIFRNIRFPLHDHFRHNSGWSNTQVLVRFTVVQSIITLILALILIKIR